LWIILALFSALFAATRRTSEKQLTHRLHYFSIALATQLLSLPIIFVVLIIHGRIQNPFSLGLDFWVPLIIVSIGFYPLNAFLYLKAIKESELSSVLPIQSLWPVLTLLPAWLILREVPNVVATIGIVLTVLGVYALGLKGRSLHHPLQPFRESRGSLYMLLAVILVTIAGVLDKIAIQASNAAYYSFVSTIGAVIVLSVVWQLSDANDFHVIKKNVKELSVIGSLQGASYTAYLVALSLGPIAYVSSIRSSNILLGSLLGIFLLKEKLTIAKAISFLLILLGGIMLALN